MRQIGNLERFPIQLDRKPLQDRYNSQNCRETDMPNIEPLILDLLEWLDKEPRPYLDVMEAWRTSCPHLPVWEDSVARGLVTREWMGGRDATVRLTGEG